VRKPFLAVSGFGAFEDIARNPSGEVARSLASDPPQGMEVAAVVLPVSFAGSVRVLDDFLATLAPKRPDLLLGLGVHSGPGFRLERRARGRFTDDVRPDSDGAVARGSFVPEARERATLLDLERLRAALERIGPTWISEDAGGYVCDRTYQHILWRAEEWGSDALFLHVPALEELPLERQELGVRALVERWAGDRRQGTP
jgi:pyrrolidone-carboxylate peptidase